MNLNSSPDFHFSQNGGFSNNGYTWLGVLEFLQEQYRSINYKETEWLLEKQQYEARISNIEGELKAHESVNKDLIKRIKMLEYALRQERIKSSIQNKDQTPNNYESINNFFNENYENYSTLQNIINSNKEPLDQNTLNKRAKSHRPLLAKFLEEIGFEDIFSSLNENYDGMNKTNLQKNEGPNYPSSMSTPQVKNQSNFLEEKKEVFRDSTPTNKSRIINETKSPNEGSKNMIISKNSQETKVICNYKCSLKSHLDGVRDLFFCYEDDVLVSVSEDCMIKLWDIKSIESFSDENVSMDPYLTLREHTGPLFTITGENDNVSRGEEKENIIFTAGSEGNIKCWSLPSPNDYDGNGSNENKDFCYGSWNAHDDSVWELNYHPTEKTLISAGADGLIKLWKISKNDLFETEPNQYYYNGIFVQKFSQNITNSNNIDSPTSICWINTNLLRFASGYVNNTNITIFDKENGKIVNNFVFKPEEKFYQTNKVLSHKTLNFLTSAHEDKCLRFFDLNTNKLIKSLNAHSDSISSIAYSSNGFTISSVGLDNYLKIWDIRKYECIYEANDCHYKKFDENIHVIKSHFSKNYFATGGADGIIKIYNKLIK